MGLTAEQLAMRQKGLGGSDAGAIAGVSPYKGAFDVWARFHIPGAPAFVAGEAAKWGNVLEPVVADEFSRVMGIPLVEPKTTFVSEKHPHMIANVDRLSADGKVLVECKTAGFRQADRWGEAGSDMVPEEYRLQVVHYMIVRPEVEVAYIPVLIGGQEFRVFTIERDRELEQMLVDLEHEFWTSHVVTGIRPAIEQSVTAPDWLSRLHPRATLPETSADDEQAQAAREFDAARAAYDIAKAEKDRAGNRLRALIGDSAGFRWGKSKATWTNNKDGVATDWEAVAREVGATHDVIARHTHATTGARVLRVAIKE